MRKTLIYWFQIYLVCIFVSSCENKKELVYKTNLKHIIVDSFYESMHICSSISYLMDTATLDGPSIFYYPNGKIEKWLWYRYEQGNDDGRYPIGGVYYDSNEFAIKIGGSPIVRKGNDIKGNFVMELICPPLSSEHTEIQIIDSFNNKLIKLEEYEPIKTDSTAWVSFPNSKLVNGHNYTIKFLLINSTGTTIDSYTLTMSVSP